MQNNGDFASFGFASAVFHGQYLSYDDRGNIAKMIESMVYNALLPWVERQMRNLNELVIARRGISRSLTTGVRKWFGAAAGQQATSVTYENLLPLVFHPFTVVLVSLVSKCYSCFSASTLYFFRQNFLINLHFIFPVRLYS